MIQQPHILLSKPFSRISHISRTESLLNHFPSSNSIQFYPNSPLVPKITKLHLFNIQNHQKYQMHAKALDHTFQTNKTKYFMTLHQRHQSADQKIQRKLQLKSQTVREELKWKNDRQKENLQKICAQNKRRVDSFYKHKTHQMSKAAHKKHELMNSRSKSAKKYRQKYISGNKKTVDQNLIIETEKSKELQQRSHKKLNCAKTKRKSFFEKLSKFLRNNLELSTTSARENLDQKLRLEEQQLLEKSFIKIQTTELLINQQSSIIHKKSKLMKQNSSKRLNKVQNNKKLKQKQIQDKIQKLFQSKNEKAKLVEYNKMRGLKEMSTSLMVQRQKIRQHRSKCIEKVGERNKRLREQIETKYTDVLRDRVKKRLKVDVMRNEIEQAREKMHYSTLQLTLRR